MRRKVRRKVGRESRPLSPASAVAALLAVALLVPLAGCTGSAVQNDVNQLKERVGKLEQDLAALRSAVESLTQELRSTDVTIYLKAKGEDLLVPVTRSVPAGEEPMAAALRALVAGPQAGEAAEAVLPAAAKVLSVQQKDGTATADFSADVTRMNVGSMGEALAVAAIVNTLTGFPGVQQVQLLVEGKKVETLAGHVDVSGPLTRNEKLIKR